MHLLGLNKVETVEKVYNEALAGDPLRPGYVEVSSKALHSGIHKIHAVSIAERINFALEYENADALDAGERDLFAHIHGRMGGWITSCADRGALRAALIMGWKDKIISLENLIKHTGENPNPPTITPIFRSMVISSKNSAFVKQYVMELIWGHP